MTVSKALGFKFLWIDRYCIDQQDAEHALAQIGQMDAIYSNSEVTIIAVAGEDPTYGLPGVSHRGRQPQFYQQIGSCVITKRPEGDVVALSHWDRRGWTYQEGLLSRRRLIFTDEQVIFECHGMYCHEALDIPYASMHAAGEQRMDAKFHTSPTHIGLFPLGVGATPQEIFMRIEEFSRKDLSYQADRLNAFLGVLRVYYLEHGVRHLWGVPILHFWPTNHRSGTQIARDEPSNPESLFVIGLCWECKPQGRDVDTTLPSWSWTGWSCSIDYSTLLLHKNIATLDVTVQVEYEDGQAMDWIQFYADYQSIGSSRLGRYLRLEAWTVPVNLSSEEKIPVARIRFCDGALLTFPYKTLVQGFGIKYGLELEGLLLCNWKPTISTQEGFSEHVFLLLVQTVDDGKNGIYKRRVGCSWLGRLAASMVWARGHLITEDGAEHEIYNNTVLNDRYGSGPWWREMNPVRKTHRLG